jgi:hypothetical protein
MEKLKDFNPGNIPDINLPDVMPLIIKKGDRQEKYLIIKKGDRQEKYIRN